MASDAHTLDSASGPLRIGTLAKRPSDLLLSSTEQLSPWARFQFDCGVIAAADNFEGWIQRMTAQGHDPGPIVKDALNG